jgi:hypothetical protein
LTAGYASAFTKQIEASPNASQVSSDVENALTKSFASAADLAQQYPQYSKQIIAAASTSFVDGADWAYTAGIVAILLGAALVFFMFPKKAEEQAMLAGFAQEDQAEEPVS